ncbi:MAG TPA: glycoside hydrolase family 31 protein [Pyrinomonadaceae bacterium]|jgi:alpha-glucosidase|nr:glycoside hydrolase family 31 protein [Pyrinomonadaceae bacterium]
MTERLRRRRAPLIATLFSTLSVLLLLFTSAQAARAAWRAAGDVKSVSRQADGVVLTLTSGARVAVTFVTPEVVRVRFAPGGTFERDFSYAVEPKERTTQRVVVREYNAPKSGFEAGSDSIGLTVFGGANVTIRRHPFLITVTDDEGHTVVEDDPARQTVFDPETGAVECSKKRVEWETYYGLGEKAGPTLSRDTQQFVMWNTDTYGYPRGLDPIYQSIGFFIALRQGREAQGHGLAYGLFLDNTSRTYFDMGKTDPARLTFGAASGELNYYVFTGGRERTPKNVLRDYTDLTGRAPLPPLWALGNQQSRWSYSPESRVREVAKGFRDARIPADVIYLDIDYMDGHRVFTWDKSRFPDPSKMIADLRAEGFRVVVIVDPGVKADPAYYAYQQGQAAGHFVKNADGTELHASVWPGVCAFPDFTDPSAREWFGSLYKTNLDEGVAGFWNDMNEPGVFLSDTTPKPDLFHHPMKTFPLTARHAGDGLPGTHARYHNVFGMQMARATFEGLKRLRPDARPFVLTRAGYAGVQRFSAIWTGDNVASWDHLRLSITMLLNLGVSGVPLIGSDVGGFSGNPTPELYTRWLQAAALTPFLRSHSENGSNPHEPYSFPKEFTDINRASIELRYRLLPYLYTLFREHTATGAPVMRPLWFEYPDDARTYLVEDQYLVGRDLLVAPVVTESVTKRKVYFPKGDRWVDWWTGKLYEGGQEVEIDAPLNRLPLFARAGAVIPTQPVVQHTGEMSSLPLSLLVVRGADGASSFYEDAGDGYEYQRGAARTTTATQQGVSLKLARAGAYSGARNIGALEFLPGQLPREVRVRNGVALLPAQHRANEHDFVLLPPAESVEEFSLVP